MEKLATGARVLAVLLYFTLITSYLAQPYLPRQAASPAEPSAAQPVSLPVTSYDENGAESVARTAN